MSKNKKTAAKAAARAPAKPVKKKGVSGLLITGLAALVTVIVLWVVCPSFSGGAANIAPGNEGVWENVSAADWMANISGSLKLSEISIPGSHDACTENVVVPVIGRCQDSDISGQLTSGVRMLDIRLSYSGESLTLCHGPLDCKAQPYLSADALSFDEVLSQCREFLAAHPTETVIMMIKHERGDASAESFEQALSAYIDEGWYTKNANPTLDEVRGKLVLARRYGAVNDNGRLGLDFVWEDQGGSGLAAAAQLSDEKSGGFSLSVQDKYEYKAADKWGAVKACLDGPSAGSDSFSLNYLSTKGPSSFGVPEHFASVLNRLFMEKELRSGTNYGIVMFDFVTTDLARHVFASNTYAKN